MFYIYNSYFNRTIMDIQKEDIPLLNAMLEYILEKGKGYNFEWSIDEYIRHEESLISAWVHEFEKYSRLFYILEEHGILENFPNKDYIAKMAQAETARLYYINNKFQKIYDQEVEETEIRRIEGEKLRSDATLSKWSKNTYWWLFTASLIALGLSLYNFISGLFEK